MRDVRDERGLYAIAFLLAAALRFSSPAAPLSPDETAHAWRAAQAAATGTVDAAGVTNPALASAQALLFVLVEPGVALARLPAALCGALLVLVPLLVRDALGAPRAVALAFLLACCPALVLASRQAAGPGAALLFAALSAAALVRWHQAARRDAADARRFATAGCAAAGVLVACGPEAWSMLPLVGLLALALRPWRACPAPAHGVWAFAGAAFLSATAAAWAIRWAAGISASLTVWLAGLARPADASPIAALCLDQPFTLLLALASLIPALHARPPRALPYAAALAWGLLLASRGAGSTLAVTAVLLPCAASGAVWLCRGSAPARGRVLLGGLAAAAAVVQLGLAARPALQRAPVPQAPGLQTLGDDLERVAVTKGRDAGELAVLVAGEPPDAELGWALRRQRAVRYVSAWDREAEAPPVLIVRDGDRSAGPPAGYVGTRYASSRGMVELWVHREP